MNEAPQRAFVLVAKISADSRNALVRHLEMLAGEIERSEVVGVSISGGYDSGHTLELLEDPTQTHQKYFQELRAHLEAKRAAASEPGSLNANA